MVDGDGSVQVLSTTLHVNGFDDIVVEAGIPVVLTIPADASSLNGNSGIQPADYAAGGRKCDRIYADQDGNLYLYVLDGNAEEYDHSSVKA